MRGVAPRNLVVMMNAVPSAAMRAGTALDMMVADNHAKFVAAGNHAAITKLAVMTLTWASICSGGEGVMFAFIALEVFYNGLGFKIRFVHVFSCVGPR